jgi:hypothetical protein
MRSNLQFRSLVYRVDQFWRSSQAFTSGETNLLLMDGHSETSERVVLPQTTDQFIGDKSQYGANQKYIWNVKHQ